MFPITLGQRNIFLVLKANLLGAEIVVDLDRENDSFTAFVDVALQAYSPPRTPHKLVLQDPGLIIERPQTSSAIDREQIFFFFLPGILTKPVSCIDKKYKKLLS